MEVWVGKGEVFCTNPMPCTWLGFLKGVNEDLYNWIGGKEKEWRFTLVEPSWSEKLKTKTENW